jgi:membrane-associated two-gene conflict system component 1 (EACC1)
MAYRLHVDGDAGPDDLRTLAAFLSEERELRGRVNVVDEAPPPGKLGAVSDVLVVAVGSGGALTVLAGAVAAWVQSRGSKVKVLLQGPAGQKAEIAAEHVKSLDAAELRRLVADVDATLRALDESPHQSP